MKSLEIHSFSALHLNTAIAFVDEFIGEGYFDLKNLTHYLNLCNQAIENPSLVLVDPKAPSEILGLRLTLPAGGWIETLAHPPLASSWKFAKNEVAYFKTILIHPSLQGQGWGQRLSNKSMQALQRGGVKAIVCHSWKESPNNSSESYLKKLGFEKIGEIQNFWKSVGYGCVRCGKGPCLCTAIEMIKYLEKPI